MQSGIYRIGVWMSLIIAMPCIPEKELVRARCVCQGSYWVDEILNESLNEGLVSSRVL